MARSRQRSPPPSAPPIVALDDHTASLVRSSLVISSLPCALLELVQNALDAHATSIKLTVNLTNWTLRCSDNGEGIPAHLLPRIGQRYATCSSSSSTSISTSASTRRRGEALASLAQMGWLELSTRAKDEQQGWEVGLGAQERLYERIIPQRSTATAGDAAQAQAPCGGHLQIPTGTTVTVRDLFYQWPVRRKPLSTPSGRSTAITQLRKELATIALAHPTVAFSLVDTSTNDTTNSLSSTRSKTVLAVQQSSTDAMWARWKQVWGKAGVEHVHEFHVHERPDQTDLKRWHADGFFSLSASHSKSEQFIFVNSRPVSTIQLYGLINARFGISSFARNSSSLLATPHISPNKTSPMQAARKSPKKVTERYPIFALRLQPPDDQVEWALEADRRGVEFQDLDRVETFVQSIVDAFLRAHGHLPTPTAQSQPTTPTSPTSDTPPRPISLARSRYEFQSPQRKTTPARESPRARPMLPERPGPIVFPFPESGEGENGTAQRNHDPIEWVDPRTKQRFLVDPRTGHSWSPAVAEGSRGRNGCDSNAEMPETESKTRNVKKSLVDRSNLKKPRLHLATNENGGDVEEEMPTWLTSTLQEWHNPIFPSNPAPVRSVVPHATTGPSDVARAPQNVVGHAHRFHKVSLTKETFIAQLDAKYLLVKLQTSVDSDPSTHDSQAEATAVETLAVIDQHAASERVRVERLLQEYCGSVAQGQAVATTGLNREAGELILVSSKEAEFVKEHLGEFERWGIVIGLDGSDSTGSDRVSGKTPTTTVPADYAQLRLLRVPQITADRLSTEPKLQQSLVRSFIPLIESNPSSGSALHATRGPHWTHSFKDAPPVMIDLINSKACRGAIMFNDHLTPHQCMTLITQLGRTNFPFICAHGRPSLMPLVNLAPVKESSRSRRGKMDWRMWARKVRMDDEM